MNIIVNGEEKLIHARQLADALVELGWEETHVATALNGQFIPHTERDNTTLTSGDQLEVLTAMQGG